MSGQDGYILPDFGDQECDRLLKRGPISAVEVRAPNAARKDHIARGEQLVAVRTGQQQTDGFRIVAGRRKHRNFDLTES